MARNCGKCVKSIRGLDIAKCSGFCEQAFHIACCGLTRPNYELITGQALWLCEACRSTVNNRPLNELLSANDVITQFESLKQEVVDLKEKLSTLSETITNCTTNVKDTVGQLEKKVDENNTRVDTIVADVIEEKLREVLIPDSPLASRRSQRRNRAQVAYNGGEEGTGDMELTDLSVPNLVPDVATEVFWLYLSGFNPHVSADDISKVVRSCLQTDDSVKVVKLVPKNADLNKLTFVSFKVGLPPSLSEDALQPSSWPKGIRFREFENMPARNRRADTPTM